MGKFIVQGGGKLKGEIEVMGAKNAALKILAATILSQEECTVKNMPQIEDITRMIDLLIDLGTKVKKTNKKEYRISTKSINKIHLDLGLVQKLRASVMLAGPLLARFKEVTLPHPGGCIIGQRPIDLFLDGFKTLGAKVEENENYYRLSTKKLKGGKIVLPKISVTVTEAMMMTATLAEGETQIKNAAMEPEIPALAEYLNKHGAKIEGAGTSAITIKGVKELGAGDFELIPDRIETGTFVILGLITGNQIKVTKCNPEHLETLWLLLKKAGARFHLGKDYVITYPGGKLKGVNLITHEYPGFATDLQAPFTVLMTQAHGLSLIHETIFEGRLFYTDILNQMGANIIMCDPHRVVINGPSMLYGRRVVSPDLRAGIALVLAALVAEGESQIENIYQIDRGYEKIHERLQKLGAKIKRIDGDE